MSKMKKFDINKILLPLLAVTFVLSAVNISAQTVDFQRRYDLLVSKVGHSGVGVETLIKEWEKVDSTGQNMLLAKFDFYFSKSQTEAIVTKSQKKYLGMDPLLSLQDSLGNKVYYYREVSYDDEWFSRALKTAERLVALYPDELSHRFLKANALVAYEKENPDMAFAYLSELISQNQSRRKPWNYDGKKMDDGFFADAIQEYCHTFYTVGSSSSRKIFYDLSVRMSKLFPGKLCYYNNIATYHLVQNNDPKLALKYYNKVLKKDNTDEVALRNSIIAARQSGNRKLETKYRLSLQKSGYTE